MIGEGYQIMTQECLWPEDQWQRSCLECIWGQKTCTLNGKEMVLHSPEKSRGEGSSKKWKVAELPPLGEVSVLDVLVGLSDEVQWLQEEVKQQGKWIFSAF